MRPHTLNELSRIYKLIAFVVCTIHKSTSPANSTCLLEVAWDTHYNRSFKLLIVSLYVYLIVSISILLNSIIAITIIYLPFWNVFPLYLSYWKYFLTNCNHFFIWFEIYFNGTNGKNNALIYGCQICFRKVYTKTLYFHNYFHN